MAADIYCSSSGNDANPGTALLPVLTLVRMVTLINAAGAGSRGYLSGTFNNQGISGVINGTNTTEGSGLIRITCRPGYSALITGGGVGMSGWSYFKVDNIDFDNVGHSAQNAVYGSNCHHGEFSENSCLDGGAGNGIILFSHNAGWFHDMLILDNEVSYPNQSGIDLGSASHGIYLSSGHTAEAYATAVAVNLNVLVQGNNVHHCISALPVYTTFTYCIQVYGGGENNQLNGITINGNELHHSANGIVFGWAWMAGSQLVSNNLIWAVTYRGIEAENCDAPKILQNTIDGPQIGVYIGAIAWVRNAQIKNNELSDTDDPAVIVNNGSSATVTGNNAYGGSAINANDPGGLSTFSSNRTNNPGYVDAAGGDFTPTGAEVTACITLLEAQFDKIGTARDYPGACAGGAIEPVPVPVLSAEPLLMVLAA